MELSAEHNRFKIQVLDPCSCHNQRYPVYITRKYERTDIHGITREKFSKYLVYCPLCQRHTAEKESREASRLDWNNSVVGFANFVGDFQEVIG